MPKKKKWDSGFRINKRCRQVLAFPENDYQWYLTLQNQEFSKLKVASQIEFRDTAEYLSIFLKQKFQTFAFVNFLTY